MNANAKSKIIRVGRYFFDKTLQEDGYGVEDIFGADDPIIELPELMDATKRRALGWLMCPHCGQKSQIERLHPVCPACGWNEEDCGIERTVRCKSFENLSSYSHCINCLYAEDYYRDSEQGYFEARKSEKLATSRPLQTIDTELDPSEAA